MNGRGASFRWNRTFVVHVFLFVFVMLGLSSIASGQYWCGYPFTPPVGPPPEPPCCECEGICTASPNFIAKGNYTFSATDLHLPTRGLPLTLTRHYDSARMVDGPFGISWTSSFTGTLMETTYLYSAPSTYSREVNVLLPNGMTYRFRENTDGSYTPFPANHYKLIKNGDGTFELTLPQSRIRYNYSSTGLLTSQLDEYGNSLLFTYNENGRLERVSDGTGSGRYLEFLYGADGRVSTLRDSANRTVSYVYNAQGALTSATDAAARQTLYGYANGRFAPLLNQIKDHWNRVITTITYDSSDRTSSYTDAGESYYYGYKYQDDPFKVLKTNSNGIEWVFTFNSDGYITSRVSPYWWGSTTTTAFNADGSIQNSVDEMGIKTSYTYNPDGSVATITRDDTGPQAVRFDYAYDPNFTGKVISITPKNPSSGAVDPNWQAWQYDYHPTGSAPGALHHVYRVRSDGTTFDTLATYTYNSAGQVLNVTDGSGAVTTYSYDSTTGDLASVTYPKNSDAGANPVYQYGRDTIGRVTSVIDPLNHTTAYTYDNLDRITSITLPKPAAGSPLNFVTTYSYDNYDSVTGLLFSHQTDPNSKLTKQGYDQFGQMIRSIDALNKLTLFTYTKGLLTSITDANNNVTTYAYNALRRLTTTTFPNAATETYTYYADGLLANKTDRRGYILAHAYDRFKRLTSKTPYQGPSITYTYTGQKLISVNDAISSETHSFAYDTSYRVASNTQGSRGTIAYTYDSADRIATYSVSGGPFATYNYYEDGSLKTIAWSPIVGQFDYQYSLTGQYSTITFPNTQSRNYSYDDQGRLLQLANTIGQTDLGTFAYGYDNPLLGQRTSMTSGLGATAYTYDSNYQLTGATYPSGTPFNGEVHAWTYDNIGNRLTNTVNASTANYTYFKNGSNPLNGQRLQSDGVKTYAYDANGNVTGDGTYTYSWDYENRLIGITGGGLTASYSYDYVGRRKTKTVNGVTTTYLYDGQNLIREIGASTADYAFGPGIDAPLAQSRSGTLSYYDLDGVGSITALDDPSGAIQNSYTYDAWGVIRNQIELTSNSFTYTARENAEAGLMYYRARYLSRGIGRFVSEDPLRYSAGPNPFSYVDGNPIIHIDPLGLICWECQYDVKSGGEIIGGAFVKFHCVSDCVGKRRVVADVKARVAGTTVGFPPITFSQSSITLCDTYPLPYAKHLEGDFVYSSGGGGVGPIGASCTKIKLGEAESKTVCSRNKKSFGISADAFFYGSSKIENAKEEDCCEQSD